MARFGLRARYFHRLLADRARLGFLPLGSAALPMVTLLPDIAPRVSRLTWLGWGIHHRARIPAILAPLIARKANVLLVALLSPHCGLAQLFDALRSGQRTSSCVLTLVLGATATVAAISCWVALEQRSFIPARQLSDLAAVAAGRHLRTRYPDWREFAVHRHWRSQCTKPCGKRFSLCRANGPETLTVAPSGRYHSLQPAPTSAR